MKIQFEATLKETVDVQMRLFRLSNSWKRSRLLEYVGGPVLFACLGLLESGDPMPRFIITCQVTGAWLALCVVYDLFFRWKLMAWRVQKYDVEVFGSAGPYPYECELDDEGVIVRKAGEQNRYLWSHLTRINDHPSGIEFIYGKEKLVNFPKRAFADQLQQEEWLKFAREKLRQNQQS